MQYALDLFRPPQARPRALTPVQPAPPAGSAAGETDPLAVSNDNRAALKQKLARLEQSESRDWGVAPFGDARVDACFPGGGLPLGRLHEVSGAGMERETPASAAGFAACLAQRTARDGAILWALQREDVYAPGLQAFGIDADRLIFVRADKDAETLSVMEAALRTRGIGAVIGEIAALSLTAGRRLQLACEQGATAFVLRRRLYGAPGAARAHEASPASTRWRIAPASSETDEPGLGAPRWSARLERCRGGRNGAWIMEAQGAEDATGAVRVVAELADHAAEASDGQGLRAGRTRLGVGDPGRQHAGAGGG